MKIIVVGSYMHPMYAKAVYDEFARQGYETYAFDCDQPSLKVNKLFYFIHKVQERLLIGPLIGQINKRLFKLFNNVDPDFVFIYRGTHIKPATVRDMKKQGSIVFSYHNDDPFCGTPSLSYSRHYIKSAYLCDFNYVYRQKNITDYKNIGVSNVEVLRSYYIKQNNYPIINCEKKYDIIFAGHFENDGRDNYIKALKESGLNIIVFGDEAWKLSPLYQEIKSVIKKDKRNSEYNKLLNETKIALVFLSKINNDTYTRRCFEIPAVKTLMLSEYTDDLASMFEPDKEAVYFKSINELIEKCKFLLDNPSTISEIGNNGYIRLMKDGHIISDRINQIVEKYNQIIKKN